MSEELIEEIPAEESVEEIAGEYPEITRRYKAGEELFGLERPLPMGQFMG